jgi:hypothetical protein
LAASGCQQAGPKPAYPGRRPDVGEGGTGSAKNITPKREITVEAGRLEELHLRVALLERRVGQAAAPAPAGQAQHRAGQVQAERLARASRAAASVVPPQPQPTSSTFPPAAGRRHRGSGR